MVKGARELIVDEIADRMISGALRDKDGLKRRLKDNLNKNGS